MLQEIKKFLSGDGIYPLVFVIGVITTVIAVNIFPTIDKTQDQRIQQLEERVQQLELNRRK